MEPEDKKVLNACLSTLIDKVNLTVRLKAEIMSSLIFEDDELDNIFDKDDDDALFEMMQLLKRKRGSLPPFIESLRKAGQPEVADLLQSKRSSLGSDGTSIPSSGGSRDTSGNVASAANPPRTGRREETGGNANTLDDGGQEFMVSTSLAERAKEISEGKKKMIPIGGGQMMSIGDLQTAVTSCLRRYKTEHSEGCAVLFKPYGKEIVSFAHAQTDKYPGELQVLDDSQIAHCGAVVGFLDGECASQLGKLLGGTANLHVTKRHGAKVMVGKDNATKYVGIKVYAQPSGEKLFGGDWWVAADVTIRAALTACFQAPVTRAKMKGSDVGADLDLEAKVIDWFRNTDTIGMDVWEE